MSIDFEALNDEFPVEDVLRSRFNVRVHNRTFKCPFHADEAESGSIYRDKATGRQRYKCHAAGCGVHGDVWDLAGLGCGSDDVGVRHRWLTGSEPNVERAHAPKKKPRPELVFDLGPIPPERLGDVVVGKPTPEVLHAKGFRKPYTPVLVHAYRDRDNRAVMLVVRIETGRVDKKGKLVKAFLPLRWDRSQGWVCTGYQPAMAGRPAEERYFYREAYLAASPDLPVLVLEGEHKTDIVAAIPAFADYVVISWAGGAPAMKLQPWSKLHGRKVTFWPDADPHETGDGELTFKTRPHMEAACRACEAEETRIVHPLDEWLQKNRGYDAKDLLADLQAEGKPASEARALMESLAIVYREEEEEEPPKEPPQSDPEASDAPTPEWVHKRVSRNGRIARVVDQRDENNLLLWIRDLDRGRGGFAGRFSRDVFTNEVLLDGQPLPDGIGPREVSLAIARIEFLTHVTPDKVRPIISDVADLTPVNRLAAEVRGLAWDHIHRHLMTYAGANTATDRWARVAGHRWLQGLVRRILSPGWQHDGVLVLEGLQGLAKTSFFRAVGTILGRDLFVEVDKLTRDPDTQMLLQGKCVVELSEMTAQRQGDHDALKGMLTSRFDTYRRPYARLPEKVPRTCVFGGSTNEKHYLKDTTGNRRYWIVPITLPMHLDQLAQDMPQLLAQAVWYIEHGDPVDAQNWLTPEEEAMQEEMATSREVEWPQFDNLDTFLGNYVGAFVTREQLWVGCGFPNSNGRSNLLKTVMTKLMNERGWVEARDGRTGPRGFRKPGTDPDIP